MTFLINPRKIDNSLSRIMSKVGGIKIKYLFNICISFNTLKLID